ncbi:hypothetical protein EBT25_02885 [bacterium]|nr:hypothetical protein [bacterium]
MEGELSSSVVMLALIIFWFGAYWIGGGVIFSIISMTRFLHVHKARFSCFFTLLSMSAAYGAAWMGSQILAQSSSCTERGETIGDAFQLIFLCGESGVFSSGILWFLLLMAVGLSMMLLFRRSEERK